MLGDLLDFFFFLIRDMIERADVSGWVKGQPWRSEKRPSHEKLKRRLQGHILFFFSLLATAEVVNSICFQICFIVGRSSQPVLHGLSFVFSARSLKKKSALVIAFINYNFMFII